MVENDEVNLPATLTKLPETIHQQQSYNEGVIDEEKTSSVETVSENNASTVSDSLELGCDDEGLIVIQTDVKQVEEENATRVYKEEKHVARTK